MKLLLSILAVFFFVSSFAAGSNYQQTIYVESVEDNQFDMALKDLVLYLRKSTGNTYQVKKFSGEIKNGIYFLWNKKGLIADSLQRKLTAGTIEDFILSGNSDRLLVVSNHPTGFALAIYTYLDMLGIKWYFPGEKWEYVPAKADISYLYTKYFSPSFHMRNFFGTGGIRPIKEIDPETKVARDWEDWKRRNRLGGEYTLGGHYGEVFNYKHKAELETHPEYLALINGRRQWSATNKWCVSNKDFRKLFVADRVEELTQLLNKRKYPNEKIVLSVDPADGSEDCECENCKRLGTVSERSYLLANEVAKAFAKISPFAFANIYAYNTHAAPPEFSLASNLIVQIVPYAFQTVGIPEQMISQWKARHSNLLIYDYYCLPDWHYDYPQPLKTSPDTLVKRIYKWKDYFNGITLETSYGIGLSGLGLYLMSRLSWDIHTNVNSLKEKFLQDMFGEASSYMRDYYENAYNKYDGIAEVSYLQSLLKKADNNNPSVHARIDDLKNYLHYLYLYYQYSNNYLYDRDKAWENMMDFVWKIYSSKIVHTTRLAELLYANANNKKLASEWSIYEPVSGKIKSSVSKAQAIEQLQKKDEANYPLLEGFPYTKRKSLFNYSLLKPIQQDNTEFVFLNWPQTFIRASAKGSFEFSLKVRKESNETIITPISLTCIDTALNKIVFQKEIKVGYDWFRCDIPLPDKKAYKLLVDFKPWIIVRIPNNQWIGFSNIPLYSAMGQLWFYLPATTKYFYYINNSEGQLNDPKDQPKFKTSTGAIVIPEKVNDLNVYRVKNDGLASGWWMVENTQYKRLEFFLKGDLFFTHKNYSVSLN